MELSLGPVAEHVDQVLLRFATATERLRRKPADRAALPLTGIANQILSRLCPIERKPAANDNRNLYDQTVLNAARR